MAGKEYKLGESPNYFWVGNKQHIDLSFKKEEIERRTIETETQSVCIDLNRTALIVVDMQNDFCTEGGWLDSIGIDYTPERLPIEPLQKLIPAVRDAGIKIIWVNWGNRSDYMNMPPNQLWVGKWASDGNCGYGDLNKQGSKVLEKSEWAANVVDELKTHILPQDIKVDKHRYSGFWDTHLDTILRNLDIKSIIFTGVNTDMCVHHTLSDANFLGYGCFIVRDCVSSTSPKFVQDATFWQVSASFGWVTNSQNIIEGLTKET